MAEKQVANKVETQSDKIPNQLKWGLIVILLISGFVIDMYFLKQPTLSLRLSVWAGVIAAMVVCFSQTREAALVLDFSKQSVIELQKVVWPTRQETVQTALIVGVVVFSVGIVLWGIDAILLWLVGLLTGQRG